MEPKYIVKIGITKNAPSLLILLDDAGSISGNPILFIFSKLIQRLTGASVDEYERTVKIFRKPSFFTKELVYEEKIPQNITDNQETEMVYMLKKSAEDGSIHQILSNNGYRYDKNGNMINNGSDAFEYDFNNRLVRVTKGDGTVITYEYDADGRRTSKTVSATVTKYFYDGDSTNVLYETDGSGNLLARFIYNEGDYKPIAMVRGGTTYFYHYNGHGDVVALTDSTGATVAEYDYDAYGLPTSTPTPGSIADLNPFHYAGYYPGDYPGL